MTKSRRSILNSISGLLLNLSNGLLGFVVTYLVIMKFGSDFNGINSTANQIVAILLLLEGGFTLATNVALFQPYHDKERSKINSIIATTAKKFKRIGLLFLALGLLTSYVYSVFVISDLNRELIFTVILMALIPSAFNLFYATKYRIIIQAEQKEYIISVIGLLSITMGHLVNIVFICFTDNMLTVRLITMCFALLQSLLLALYCKKHYPNIDYHAPTDDSLITGTRDVFVQKVTAALYNTLPMLSISFIASAGATMASVYAIYNNVYQLIKALLQAIMDGPRLSLGQLIIEHDQEYVYQRFILYEFMTVLVLTVFISTTVIMIIPFVKWYSQGFVDVNYVNHTIALLLGLIAFFEILHIPSGNYINMSGNFRIAKNIQVVSAVVLIVATIIGGMLSGLYGVLVAVLLTAIYLAIVETYFVHKLVFNRIADFARIVGMNTLVIIACVIMGNTFMPVCTSFLHVFIAAAITFVDVALVTYVCNRIVFPKYIRFVKTRIRELFRKKVVNV